LTSEIQVANPVATRWAEALHSLATQKGALEEVRRDMALLAGEVRNERVRVYLTTASVPTEDKRRALAPLLSQFSTWSRNLVEMALERRREALLVGLPAAFQDREDALSGVLKGVVESARELGAGEVQDLEASLTTQFQHKVVLTTRLNPELVGGVRVFVGAHMIDRSVQGRLEDLGRKLRNAPLSHS